ncbi:MAG TPA: hypothetical protein VMI10_06300 [Terriglobales bacterium]|nr:hypothetical protein [Terriglobales bacterium]
MIVTLSELENTLPNGLHDAEIHRIAVDYVQRLVTIDLSVFVGEVDAPLEKREAYRKAALVISGLQFISIESPDARYPFAESGTLRVDLCDKKADLDLNLLNTLPANAFCESLFVYEWNAFVHLAGLGAEIQWTGPTVYLNERIHILPGETIDL